MSSPFVSPSSFFSIENGIDFYSKKIKDWYGEECLQWASETERQLNIPLSSWVHIDRFQKVTGRDLLRYKISDFKKLVNEEYGPLFFKCFRKLVKERREDKVATQYSQEHHPNFHSDASHGFTENSSSWTVPQMYFNDLPVPQDDYGFGRASPVSPLHSQDRFGENNVAVSPSFNHDYQNSFSGPSFQSHGEYRETIGELSPAYPSSFTQTDSLSSYLGTSPLPSFSFSPNESQFDFAGSSPISASFAAANKTSHKRKEGISPTYITQPSILSGGSLSYGSEAMEPNQSFNFLESYSRETCRSTSPNNFSTHTSDTETSPHSSLLPDFNSLMISNGSSPIRDNLDIVELESSLNEESFADFDKYIHDQDINITDDFDCGTTNDMNSDVGGASSLVVSFDGSIEDCMLKKITTGKRGNRVRHPQSWEFLVRLLMSPHTNPSLVKWEDKERGVFRLVQKEEIAKLWGKRSEKHKDEPLAYDNFARILRYHYKSKVLVPVSDKHLVYKLGDKVMVNLKKEGLL